MQSTRLSARAAAADAAPVTRAGEKRNLAEQHANRDEAFEYSTPKKRASNRTPEQMRAMAALSHIARAAKAKGEKAKAFFKRIQALRNFHQDDFDFSGLSEAERDVVLAMPYRSISSFCRRRHPPK